MNLAGLDNPEIDYLRDVRHHGMTARYYCGPRHRVPSRLRPNARRNVGQVFKQVGKDVAKHRVLVVDSDHADYFVPVRDSGQEGRSARRSGLSMIRGESTQVPRTIYIHRRFSRRMSRWLAAFCGTR